MIPINNIKTDPLTREQLEINANATPAPNYLINQDQLRFQDPGVGTDTNVSANFQKVRNTLENIRSQGSLNFIANFEVEDAGAPPPPPPPSSFPTPTDSGSDSGSVNGSGSGYSAVLDMAGECVDESESLTQELTDENYTLTDSSDYEYIDPKFWVVYNRLNSVLIAIQIIGLILDALLTLRKMVTESSLKEEQSISDVLNTCREIGNNSFQKRLLLLTQEVTSFNQNLLTDRTQRQAESASTGSYNIYDIGSEVVTSGGSDAMSRHEQYNKAKIVERELRKFEEFQERVMQEYEKVLGGNSSLYRDGINSDMGEIFSQLGSGLIHDVGGGKVDVDRNRLAALQLRLSGMENYRQILALIHEAKLELIGMVSDTKEFSAKIRGAMQSVVNSLTKYEGTIFSNLSYQMQNLEIAYNNVTDAQNQTRRAKSLYYSSATLGSLILVGGITKNWSDYLALVDTKPDYSTKPTQLDTFEVYQILAEMTGSTAEQIRKNIGSADEYVQKLDMAEQIEWDIIRRASDQNLVGINPIDNTAYISQATVNALAEEMNRVQIYERIVFMTANVANRIRRMTSGSDDAQPGKELNEAVTSSFEVRSTILDLKVAGLKSKIDLRNRIQRENNALEKAALVAGLSIVLTGIAVILILEGIVCPPSFILVIGFVTACGQLGASLGAIIANALHPIAAEVQKMEFYDDIISKNEKHRDDMEERYDDEIDEINRGSFISAGGGQFAKNTRQLMEARDRLTKLYIYEAILFMINNNRQSILLATAGLSLSDTDLQRGAISSRFLNKIKALDRKEEALEDQISRMNLAAKQDQEQKWAIIMAVISALEIICSGVAQGAEVSAEVAEVGEWAGYGFQIAGGICQSVKAGMEGAAGWGELAEYNALVDEIETLLQAVEGQDKEILSSALYDMREATMVEGVGGGGKVTVDNSAYYKGIRAIQRLFNRIMLMLQALEILNRIRARAAHAQAVSSMTEVVESGVKSSMLKQLEILDERVKAYVERANDMADAWRQFTIAMVMLALKILMKIAEKTGILNDLKTKIRDLLLDMGFTGEIKLFDNPDLAKFLAGNETLVGNGTLDASSVANILVDVAFSKEFVKFITQKIYDRVHKSDRHATEVELEKTKSKAIMDQEEDRIFENQLAMAETEIDVAMLNVARQLRNELNKFWTAEVITVMQGAFDKRLDSSADVLKLSKTLNELKALSDRQLVNLTKLNLAFRKLDLNNPKDVEKAFAMVQKYLETAREKGEKLTEAQKKGVITAAAIMLADKIAINHKKDPTAFKLLKDGIEKELVKIGALDKDYIKLALAVLGSLTQPHGRAKASALSASEIKEVDSLICNIWCKAALKEITEADAQVMLDNAKSFRPEAYQSFFENFISYISQRANVPREIWDLVAALKLDEVDYTDRNQVIAKGAELEKMKKEAKINGQPLDERQRQDLVIAAAIHTAGKVAYDAAARVSMNKTLFEIVRDPNNSRNKALLDYCNAVLGRNALTDAASQIGYLPQPIQIAMVEHTNPGSVDWTKPHEVRDFHSRLQNFVEKGTIDGKPMTAQMQAAVLSAAALLVASQIDANPDQKMKAMRVLTDIHMQQKSGAEKPQADFAMAVLNRLAVTERPEVKAAAKKEAEARNRELSNIQRVIYRMFGFVKSMKMSVAKNQNISELFDKLKTSMRPFIQLVHNKEMGINLEGVLRQVANAKTQGELADILQGILNNPKLQLPASVKVYIEEMIKDLRMIDGDLKSKQAKPKTPAKQSAAQAPAAAFIPSHQRGLNYFERRTLTVNRPKSTGQKVDTFDAKRLVAEVGKAGNRGNGNGSSANDNSDNSNPQRQQPQPTLKPQDQVAYGAGKAVEMTLALHNGKHNGSHA